MTAWIVRLGDAYRALLALAFGVIGPRAAYAFSGTLARLLYRLAPPIRQRSETQCAAALGGRVPAARIRRIAEASFVHRVWNLTDLLLASRWLRRDALDRVGGRLPAALLDEILSAQRRRKPIILLTGYFGPYDLLPLLLGYNGVAAVAVYRRHINAAFDRYRTRVRAMGGCELVPVEAALDRLPRELEAGRTVAILSDHHDPRRGMDATFLGLPTRAARTVGLLACRHNADVVVAGVRRVRRSFRFEILALDTIRPADWADAGDPVVHVTERTLRGLERLVLSDPEQYLWAYERWGRGAIPARDPVAPASNRDPGSASAPQ